MGRFKHVNEVRENDEGQLVYTGNHYRIGDTDREEDTPQRAFFRLLAGAVKLAVLVVLSGCIDTDNAIGSFTVIVPLVGEVGCVFVLWWQVAKILAGRGEVRGYVLESAQEKIPAAAKVLIVFSLIGLVFSAVYLFRHGTGGEFVKSIAYVVLKAATAGTAFLFDRFFTSIKWVKA